jgi:proline dehydrogenase
MESFPEHIFDNTEVAFSGKSNKELTRSYYLFKLISNPTMVKFGKVATEVAIRLGIPIGWAIKGNIFKQFCGGESIEECSEATAALAQAGIGTILDYSVEGKESEKDFDATCNETLDTLRESQGKAEIPFCVFKVTGVAKFELLEKVNAKQPLTADEEAAWQRVVKRVDAICALAVQVDTPVFIDAEDSWIQDAIDHLADSMMEKYNTSKAIVFNTIQLYRHDRLAFLKHSHQNAIAKNYFCGFKLVRGAYMEKERARALAMNYPDPIQPNKEASDHDFDAALLYCVHHRDRISICCGSHNEKSNLYLARLMQENNIAPNDSRFYFAQLFGMSDHISYNLAHLGFNVAKYVPYGPIKEVIPYLIRRAMENTSVKGQTGRELSLILKEKARRGL